MIRTHLRRSFRLPLPRTPWIDVLGLTAVLLTVAYAVLVPVTALGA